MRSLVVIALGLALVMGAAAGAPAAPPAALTAPTAPAPEQAMPAADLEALEEAALSQNPRLRRARAQAEAAQGRALSEGSGLWPQLAASAGWSHSGSEGTGDGRETSAGLSLDFSLFDYSRWGRAGAADLEALAAWADLETERLDVILGVRQAYLRVLEAQALVGVGERFLGVTQDSQRQVEGFYRQGLRAKVDLAQAGLDVARARLNLVQSRAGVARQRAFLAEAVGVAAAGDWRLAALPLVDAGPPAGAAAQALAHGLKERPELQSLTLSIAAAQERIDQAWGGHLPTLGLSARGGRRGQDGPADWYHQVGLGLDLPLFSGFGVEGRVAEARASERAARASHELQVVVVRREVLVALADWREAAASVAVGRTGLDFARENYRLASGRHRAGIATALELSQASVDLLRAEQELVGAQYRLLVARAQLERAAAGGWWPPPAEARP